VLAPVLTFFATTVSFFVLALLEVEEELVVLALLEVEEVLVVLAPLEVEEVLNVLARLEDEEELDPLPLPPLPPFGDLLFEVFDDPFPLGDFDLDVFDFDFDPFPFKSLPPLVPICTFRLLLNSISPSAL